MLVLSRKKNESIVLGDDIEIFVVDISEDRVRIGVKAPREMKVFRKELLEDIKKENESSVEVKMELKSLSDIIKK